MEQKPHQGTTQKLEEIENLGEFSANSIHYNFVAGLGFEIKDLSEEMGIGKGIARNLSYDRGEDVSVTIKMLPGKVWMEASLTDDPNKVVSNITIENQDGKWIVHHMKLPDEGVDFQKFIRDNFTLYAELSC